MKKVRKSKFVKCIQKNYKFKKRIFKIRYQKEREKMKTKSFQ